MWLVPLKIVSNVSRFKPALILNRDFADLNRGSNSLNSISVYITIIITMTTAIYIYFCLETPGTWINQRNS